MKDKHEKAAALRQGHRQDEAPAAVAGESSPVADKIIALARRHGVPVHGDRYLIEILSTLDLYEEIPQELYKAVAELLVFVYRMSGKA